jgi:uncharacterized membrane protein YfbV (UPF0208 family)
VKLKALRQLGPAVKNRVIALSRFLLSLLGLVIVFSLGFQVIMAYEGRD